MAKLTKELKADFSAVLDALDRAIMGGSLSASLEDSEDFTTEHTRCAVRVYERYSMFGNNRVSLSVTLLESDGRLLLTAITAGGSQAVLFKINTLGEEAFLDTIRDTVASYE